MEGILGFFAFVAVVSASGALSPGPLSIATVNCALRDRGRVGWAVATGHMAFEFPLVLAISLGVINFVSEPLVKLSIGVLGSMALMVFGALQAHQSLRRLKLREAEADDISIGRDLRGARRGLWNAFAIGFLFTSLNPYFLIWWFTIGLTLIVKALALASIAGILLMYAFHIWLDYAWLGLLSHATAAGSKLLSKKRADIMSAALAIVLMGLGAWLLISVLSG